MDKPDKNRVLVKDLSALEKYIHSVEEQIERIYSKSPKKGKCTLTKLSNNPGYVLPGEKHTGYCLGIVEGYSCILQGNGNFYTSIVESIDWDKGEFKTLNSTYKFEFHDEQPKRS